MRMQQCYLRIALRARSASGLLDALGLGYDLPVGQAVYAIDAFPDDDLLWRIEWIGGVGYNTSVPSEPQIDVCLAQLPKGEKNPLSARARSSQVEKRTVKIGVGLLPYVWIGSVWQKRRPVITNLSAYRGRVSIDATSLRMVALGMATSRDNAIPRSSYLFGASWPNVCRTLLVAVEQDGDPYAVMVPTAEIIRFYYGPSTRLAQALFWGEYHNMFNADRSGIFKEGMVRVHLRRWLEDEDSWTLARYICSPLMQSEVSELYRNLQVYQINPPNLISQPDQALRCGFPFAGPTTIQGICLRLPGPTPASFLHSFFQAPKLSVTTDVFTSIPCGGFRRFPSISGVRGIKNIERNVWVLDWFQRADKSHLSIHDGPCDPVKVFAYVHFDLTFLDKTDYEGRAVECGYLHTVLGSSERDRGHDKLRHTVVNG